MCRTKTHAFPSGALPDPYGELLRDLVQHAHAQEPFSPLRPRAAARRVGALASEIGLSAHLYRGGLELTGAEVDHVWLVLDDLVVDLAFPLFEPAFYALLPRFVAGEVDAAELEKVAASTGVDARVLGVLPPRVRYVGQPVWAERDAAAPRGLGPGVSSRSDRPRGASGP